MTLGGDALRADADALGAAVGHGRAEPHFDTQAFKRPVRIRRQVGCECRQEPRTGFDQQHARLAGIDAAKFSDQILIHQLDDGARQFHTGRTAANDYKREQCGAARRVRFPLGALQRQEHPAANRGCIFQRLETRREGLPFIMAEIGMSRAGGEHQGIECDGGAVLQFHAAVLRIDTADRAEQRGHFLAPAHEEAYRPGDFRSRERGGADLVQQRLKQMMIALIDDGDAHVRAGQLLGRRQTAEPGADDDHMMRGCVLHGYNLASTSSARAFSKVLVRSGEKPNTFTWNAAAPFLTLRPRPNPGVSMK